MHFTILRELARYVLCLPLPALDPTSTLEEDTTCCNFVSTECQYLTVSNSSACA
ncbi:hypothetical protein HYPBUDRAFT_151318 [Hyphopichia burtonii NRRL Y-1933]|uniref:Uncharacterized protein n=1 Tax=Hyphopichia burtonii NRRL Y-1933 TaxID=984485 RepID=A0A1E4RQX4_9ASCO|nr:hypothetical protein HYPBUDRAFT_151318 [Hyphopichia burtonii NRRL Y-1933]ODV69626.1 hypothetical protein HYPBUDRAFT_151318 [Hyphopichia burtonii NRRL Y-1933]